MSGDPIPELLRVLHGAVSELLAEQAGELDPLAAVVRSGGAIELVGGEDLNTLLGGLHEMAMRGEIVAAAVCTSDGTRLRYRIERDDDAPSFSDVPYEMGHDGKPVFHDGSAEP